MLGAKALAIFSVMEDLESLQKLQKSKKLTKFYKVRPQLMAMIRLKLEGKRNEMTKRLEAIISSWDKEMA